MARIVSCAIGILNATFIFPRRRGGRPKGDILISFQFLLIFRTRIGFGCNYCASLYASLILRSLERSFVLGIKKEIVRKRFINAETHANFMLQHLLGLIFLNEPVKFGNGLINQIEMYIRWLSSTKTFTVLAIFCLLCKTFVYHFQGVLMLNIFYLIHIFTLHWTKQNPRTGS